MNARTVRAFLLAILVACSGAASAAARGWSLIDLGVSSFGAGINSHHDVVGYSYEGGSQHAFLWTGGVFTSLGVPPGAQEFYPTAINDRGQVVGFVIPGSAGWLWEGGSWTLLGELLPAAINKFGDVAGYSNQPDGIHAVLHHDGALTDLGSFGGRDTFALGINDRGQVAGIAQLPDGSFRAFVWEDGTMTDLGTFNGHGTGAEDINNHGQVIGEALGNNVFFGGWLHDRGTFVPIGGNAPVLFPRAINDRGEVVGEVAPPGNVPAPFPAGSFLHADGVLTRLDLLPVFAGWVQVSATDISDRGWIVGTATKDGITHAFVLVPRNGRP